MKNLIWISSVLLAGCTPAIAAQSGAAVAISFPASVRATAMTGRVYVIFTKTTKPDPRIQVLAPETSPPFFGLDVNALAPGQTTVIDANTPGFPLKSLSQLPAGDYYVEALANVYSEFHRSDGHTIWAHEQWDGQVFSLSPGNLYSAIQRVHFDPATPATLHLELDKVVSPNDIEALLGGEGYASDTPWVKHIRMLSPTLSKFWGTPIYLGATILLPKGYASHPNSHYPVVYNQGHFYQPVPWDFTTDRSTETPQAAQAGKRGGVGTGYEFYQAWNSPHFPRFLMVTWQHPCPFFDDSYAVNSANCGPYGDAIMNELIPYIDSHYRILRAPYARLLEGGSTGGWESLALQIMHPKFFGGAYVFDPDPIDFRRFQLVNIYDDTNAFEMLSPDGGWHAYQRPWSRRPDGQVLSTERQLSQYEETMGSKGRSGYQLDGWWAIFDPAGSDGYPEPLWNMQTGVIDRSIANAMRANGYDLGYDLRTQWPTIGRDLAGKLYFYVGDMDSYYLNLAVYEVEDFLKTAQPPFKGSFTYGRPMKGHGWHPMTWAQLLEQMASQVRRNTPNASSTAQWNY
jgi:Putative esterase